ncbi:hypothetical protein LUZ60_002862 [Juncus effusus]|nr:hypothetical protein LUZ60_002862 [Juncus effusus]
MLAAGPTMAATTGFPVGHHRRVYWHQALDGLRRLGLTLQEQRERTMCACFWSSPLVLRKRNQTVKEKEKAEPSSAGGEDLWSAESEAARKGGFPEHMIVMVNGLVGSAEDWRFAAEQFVRRIPDKVIVHRSECNSATLTFDGVDLMGERLADEVRKVVVQRKGVRKISFVAHSLGGLVARYAIGRLYQPNPSNSNDDNINNININENENENIKGLIAGLVPMNFITFASPHLGSRGNKQLPFLCGLPFLERSASETAHLIVGKTGKHLFLTDNDNGTKPLLVRMVDDSDNIKFRSALAAFKRRVAYANANFDHMVGWGTSSIRRQNELPKHRLLVRDEKYPHIVHVDKGDLTQNKSEVLPTNVRAQMNDLEEEMIRGLNQVQWERVDVSFQKSRQRYVAHNTIQVKSYWLNSDGEDVISHMIDNFVI